MKETCFKMLWGEQAFISNLSMSSPSSLLSLSASSQSDLSLFQAFVKLS